MNGLELCVWLNACEKLSARLFDDFSPEDITPELLFNENVISEKSARKLDSIQKDGWPRSELERAEEDGVEVVSWFDEKYPKQLKDIAEPPLVLYVKGRLPDLSDAFAVVGTRKCSQYGHKVAEMLGGALAQAGKVVISGGAIGIDGAAHSGALTQSGVTVAVFGTGVDRVWPVQHEELFDNISRHGALISEYPFGTPGRPWRFPRRNRIIAGLAKTLIAVESPIKGGAMITARLAMEMGRDVWAVPGRIDERVCEGTNRLILEGVSPLVNIRDFVEELSKSRQLEIFAEPEITDDAKKLLDCLRGNGDLSVDQISSRSGLPAFEVLPMLTDLQAQGLIYPSGGGRWRAVPK